MTNQLFHLVRDIELPGTTTRDAVTGQYFCKSRTYTTVMAMLWPNGTPCIPAELYLLDYAEGHSVEGAGGGSLRDAASALSALVRYCWKTERDFWDLRDSNFADFVDALQEECRYEMPNRRRRDANRVSRIIQVSIDFLGWLKLSGITSRTIIGPREDNPQIPLEIRRIFDRRSSTYSDVLQYRYTPVASTRQSKGPIGADARLKIWDAVNRLSVEVSNDKRFRNRYLTEEDFLFEREYFRRRRELLLDILGATGARPGEIAVLSVKENFDCASTCKIVLVTLKRRIEHKRKIPISRSLAIRLELFIHEYREKIVNRQIKRDSGYKVNDRVFLSQIANPISAATFGKEFSRIIKAAGLSGVRACMSMYRHRFITNMVALHLKEFMDKRPGHGRQMMTNDDYRTILKRVASFTGHGDPSSLLHYIDLAWDELGLFNGVEPTINLLHSLEGSIASLQSLVDRLKHEKKYKQNDLIVQIQDEISILKDSIVKPSKLGQRPNN